MGKWICFHTLNTENLNTNLTIIIFFKYNYTTGMARTVHALNVILCIRKGRTVSVWAVLLSHSNSLSLFLIYRKRTLTHSLTVHSVEHFHYFFHTNNFYNSFIDILLRFLEDRPTWSVFAAQLKLRFQFRKYVLDVWRLAWCRHKPGITIA